ncbi:crotonase/enoyl-CoA hydratase family protein [Caulobacter segnis]|uniref:crotonase/enoyl-CoA hydratase family protein n=1 Tax=Caulobacter segnis TaxID=88688 RepID=UPI00240EFC1A|nr:crotonase/enoyl-CoA hydratase family protein [Caulobacter segnis]MDG2521734.1 crotonase/enoyl-CoA hydratase family protein [Caulobacter segnis]
MDQLITTEKRGHVAILTFNRPDSLNALGAPGDGDQVAAACEAVNRDPSVRCVVLTGAGRAFSAGGDVKAMKAKEGAFAGGGISIRDNYRTNIHRIVRSIYGLEVPAIAAVNGAAVGLGCDVACMTDIRIASDQARFGVTFLKLGIIPGDGGAWLLPRTVGMSRAAELLFTGDIIDARTAGEWGLVSKVVPHATLMGEAMALAEKIAQQPPHALRLAKSLLKQGQTASYDTIMEMSAAAQALSHLTEDHIEGVDALLEKRAPNFRGA